VGKEPRDTAGFLQAAYTLFDNAASSGLLAKFGYEADRITAERAMIAAFDQANQTQEAAKGAAQRAPRKAAATRAAKKAQSGQANDASIPVVERLTR